MCFYRILDVVKAIMPLLTIVVTAFVVPGLLDWWTSRKVRCCYHSLLSHFDKFCRRRGSGTYPPTTHEANFETETEIETFIKADQDINPPIVAQHWAVHGRCQFRTALNSARIKAGLESGQFYFSRHFENKNCGELLAVLTVIGNIAEMRAFYRGPWVFPTSESELQRRLRRFKVRHFGYSHSDYSIMLV